MQDDASQEAHFADLKGRVAVVTGGASGIGLGMARHFAAEGMQVVIADVESGPLDAAARELGALGIRTDVSDLASVRALAEQVRDRFGGVDLLCNNAGVGPSGRIADMTIDDWRWLVDVNLMGVAHGLSAFLPMLLANPRGGHIVNTASIGGFVTGPNVGVYGATKAAIVAMSEALQWELMTDGAKVGVTILAPGPIRTGIFTGSRNRPADRGDVGAHDVDLATDPLFAQADWVDADAVGPMVIDAIRQRALYLSTHPAMAALVKMRMDAAVEGLSRRFGPARRDAQ